MKGFYNYLSFNIVYHIINKFITIIIIIFYDYILLIYLYILLHHPTPLTHQIAP